MHWSGSSICWWQVQTFVCQNELMVMRHGCGRCRRNAACSQAAEDRRERVGGAFRRSGQSERGSAVVPERVLLICTVERGTLVTSQGFDFLLDLAAAAHDSGRRPLGSGLRAHGAARQGHASGLFSVSPPRHKVQGIFHQRQKRNIKGALGERGRASSQVEAEARARAIWETGAPRGRCPEAARERTPYIRANARAREQTRARAHTHTHTQTHYPSSGASPGVFASA